MSKAQLPPVAFVVSHTVSNYEQWKKAFDADQANRKAAGIFGHHINRGAENPNLVAIYLPAMDRARVEAMIAGPALKATMMAAGVTSAPSVAVVTPIEDAHIGDRPTAALMITAEVENFAQWKAGYDAGAPLRASHGVIGHAVNHLADHPNTVVVYHQGESVQSLRDFIASPEIKAAMQKSGVKGPPKMEFFQSVGGAAY